MKYMLVAGPTGFGINLVNRFNADTFSRSNNYNINNQEIRQTLANKSLEYDVVIVHAYTGNNSQLLTLKSITEKWIEHNKTGNIIVTGSISSYYEQGFKNLDNIEYSANKSAIDRFCKLATKKIISNSLGFRLTIIKPGMLDTEKSRKKPHFIHGLDGEVFCDLIDTITSLPDNVLIPEIPIESLK